jgi:hypothetical protein
MYITGIIHSSQTFYYIHKTEMHHIDTIDPLFPLFLLFTYLEPFLL